MTSFPRRSKVVFDPVSGFPVAIESGDDGKPVYAPVEYAHPTAVITQDKNRPDLRPYKSFTEDRPWLRDPDNQTNFTAEAKEAFLEHYAMTGCINDAAVIAGVSEATVWNHVKYDIVFSSHFREAQSSYRDLVVTEVRRRAIHGVVKAKWHEGRIVGHEVTYSDRLLELEAKRVEPAYRESGTTVNVSNVANAQAAVVGKPDLKGLSVAELTQLRALAGKAVRLAATPEPLPPADNGPKVAVQD